jgi:hypothetical protein
MSRMRVKTLIELIATLPIDYIYYASGSYVNFLRFTRLLKCVRVPGSTAKLRSWFTNYHIYNVVRLITFSMVSSHVFACVFYLIAKSEYDNGGRFDHTSFVTVLCYL